MRKNTVSSLLLSAALALAALSAPVAASETESAMARGARLYDKWFAENKAPKPTADHPSYIKDGKYGKENSWRCKECHGWDYKGKDGAGPVITARECTACLRCVEVCPTDVLRLTHRFDTRRD